MKALNIQANMSYVEYDKNINLMFIASEKAKCQISDSTALLSLLQKLGIR